MRRSRYVKVPVPAADVTPLYQAVLQVLSAELTVTQAAELVGLSRLRFQTRMNRGLSGLLEGLAELPRGRKPTPETERALRDEVAALRRENQHLAAQANSTVRMMGLATEWMRKGLRKAGRQAGARPPEAAPSNDKDEDAGAAVRLQQVLAMRADGVSAPLAAAAVGVSPPTVRRWCCRRQAGQPLSRKRGPAPCTALPAATRQAVTLLDEVHCHIGAAPLAKATGLSRRAAGAVKAAVLTKLEQQRREATAQVSVKPGVVRGFDAVMLGKVPVLVSADGAVPFRTSVTPAPRYDEEAVANAVAADFGAWGAPLVWRVDRAKAHTAPTVMAVLRKHRVLVLQGPPHCARYYGQLERQNREHRAWLHTLGEVSLDELAHECAQMRWAFNELVPRRRLGWRTAAAAWASCTMPVVNRDELREEVEERRRKLEEAGVARSGHPGLAERLAIEAALMNRGLLRLTKGGWC